MRWVKVMLIKKLISEDKLCLQLPRSRAMKQWSMPSLSRSTYTYILMFDTDQDDDIITPPQVNSLYSGDSGSIKVNAMNAPNNSTLQVND